jgi:hypothetical protein
LLEKFKSLFDKIKDKLVENFNKIKNLYDNMNITNIELNDIQINNNVISF